MNNTLSKRVLVLFSVVERGKGQKLMKYLKEQSISMHYQCVGFGTAPTEIKDIFGIGSRDKDIIISLAAEEKVKEMMADFGKRFSSYSEYGGLMLVLKPDSMNRLAVEILNYGLLEGEVKEGGPTMKNEHNHHLILIAVGQGYSEEVMETAKRAGATGGTVIRGRLADTEMMAEFVKDKIDEERELILIVASSNNTGKIMESVNAGFGLRTNARGVICSIPIEKAYKI